MGRWIKLKIQEMLESLSNGKIKTLIVGKSAAVFLEKIKLWEIINRLDVTRRITQKTNDTLIKIFSNSRKVLIEI